MAAASRDKIPPHDDEAERAALSSLLMDADAVAVAIQYLRPGDFYSNASNRVFEAILSLDAKGLRADIQTVIQELKQLGKLDEAGGHAYVASLTNVVATSANIEYYARTVQNYSLRRALLRVSAEINARVFDESLESRIILEEVQQKIFELTDNRQTLISRKIGEVLKETIVAIDKVLKSKKQITGIPTGFETLDQYTSGFQPSEFIVIGARPSMGKTALALNMVSAISIGKNIPAAFFTLEMSDLALTQRIISSEAMVESNALRNGFMTPGDYNRILHACEKMYEAPLYIVDMPNMKLIDLRAQARKLRSQQKVEIVFIDYLGLIGSENYTVARHEQIAQISRSLKSLARELKIPIVAMCQLSREAEKEGRPLLSNLRDSGSIEQDADVVMFLHRDRVSDKKPNEPVNQGEGQPTDIIIAKQRNGPVGTVKLAFMSRYTKFVPLAREH
ncbi:MAG: replicative DNA helicase [Treponema sp.]|jgi:replicative DNA helicase|nr:replicative DNA helicase [Treponema sp.]